MENDVKRLLLFQLWHSLDRKRFWGRSPRLCLGNLMKNIVSSGPHQHKYDYRLRSISTKHNLIGREPIHSLQCTLLAAGMYYYVINSIQKFYAQAQLYYSQITDSSIHTPSLCISILFRPHDCVFFSSSLR